ncbi:MAG: glycosyltransferase family 39 protein [Saprospiraceae bacterium]|nr:glycosyltransferase family 39 protein [Saprospiraceae bacterium]
MYLSPVNTPEMDRLTKVLLIAWLTINLIQAYFTELFHDEAYYWVFSQVLDWGYKDHPPVTALLVAAGSGLLPGEIGVRLFMVLASTLAIYLTWRLIKPEDPRLFWSLLLAMPVMVLFGFLAVPDIPLLLGGVLFFTVWRAYLDRDDWPVTLALSLCLTLLAYTKYHGALLFFFALLPNLHLVRRKSFWWMTALTSLLIVPHLLWQYDHDWLSFRYHLVDRAGDLWKFRFVYEYLGSQLGIWGPFTGILLWIAAVRWPSRDPFEKSLRWVALGFLLFFFYQSWTQPTEANWTGPVFFPLLYLGYHDLKKRPVTRMWAIRLSLITITLLLIARIYLIWDFIGLPKAPEYHHWDEWAALVENVAGDVPVIFTNRYQRPSKYLFYSGKPGYCQSTEYDTGTQYDLLYAMEESVQGKSVCLVTENPPEYMQYDSIATETPVGRPLGFKWVDDFRSYNRIWCQLDTAARTFPTNREIELPVTITNPTDHLIQWEITGPRRVTFEYMFIYQDVIRQEGLAMPEIPIQSLKPGESVRTTIRVKTPVEKKEYRFRMAWRVEGLYRGKNSGFYMLDIQ